MRLNRFLSLHTSLSRRGADKAISDGRVIVNQKIADLGTQVADTDVIFLDDKKIEPAKTEIKTIILNKPVGYVCSRNGQGSQTIYELLPSEFANLNPVGRLDKDSSGLLLLTNDGDLANLLTHPSYGKVKVYEIILDKPLAPLHQQMISDHGIMLDDGNSKLVLEKLDTDKSFKVTMREGRNRQIRRTFASLGYEVKTLHRTTFGDYRLQQLSTGKYELVNIIY